ncbi:hypothetical protein FDH27_gp034 [Vibrio phage SSP002]|uniref:Uncharacterized protein n=1 Tax=Vibrio phage SSP002 TaxID=1161928 RepID=H9EB34_9CAUD|nr:hypothetical protein FDH27_gp034 [Vibrio phage SSP002]AFE86361.1 hypothetical protein SSP002_034 [Vibrio phage SSP002]
MSQIDPQEMLKQILAASDNPAELLRGAIQEATSGENGGNALQQLELLLASDPNLKHHLRSGMPASVQEHLRYVPTMIVTFTTGAFGGKPMVINKSDFDADLHEEVDVAKAVKAAAASAAKQEEPTVDEGAGEDATGETEDQTEDAPKQGRSRNRRS